MQDVLKYLITSILPDKTKIEVVKQDDENPSNETFEVGVPQDVIGRVIGKNGSVIKAIRLLASIHLRNSGKFLRINLKEISLPLGSVESDV